MKLRDFVEQYGEYEVSASFQFGSSEGIQIRLEPPKQKTNSVWELKDGDSHYWIDGVGKVKECDIWRNNSYDTMAREVGNIFLTKEEADREIERRTVETLLLKYGGRRWFKDDSGTGEKMNWHIFYGFDISVGWGGARQGTIYFDTKEQAEKAISEIGEERLKKALFEVR